MKTKEAEHPHLRGLQREFEAHMTPEQHKNWKRHCELVQKSKLAQNRKSRFWADARDGL